MNFNKAKTTRQVVVILDAYIGMGQAILTAARSYVNNPKLLKAVDLVDESVKETLEANQEQLQEAYRAIKVAEECEEKEETTH